MLSPAENGGAQKGRCQGAGNAQVPGPGGGTKALARPPQKQPQAGRNGVPAQRFNLSSRATCRGIAGEDPPRSADSPEPSLRIASATLDRPVSRGLPVFCPVLNAALAAGCCGSQTIRLVLDRDHGKEQVMRAIRFEAFGDPSV